MRNCRQNPSGWAFSRLARMGRLSVPVLAVSLAALASLGLVACGGGNAELLPGRTASEIESNLDRVAQLAGEGECVGAADAAQEVSAEVEALNGVDGKLKQALGEGAARLNEVVGGCETAAEPEEEEFESEEPALEEAESAAQAERRERAEERAEQDEKAAGEAHGPEGKGPQSPPPGKAKGHEGGEAIGGEEGEGGGEPTEAGGGPPSGGVGPAVPAEGE